MSVSGEMSEPPIEPADLDSVEPGVRSQAPELSLDDVIAEDPDSPGSRRGKEEYIIAAAAVVGAVAVGLLARKTIRRFSMADGRRISVVQDRHTPELVSVVQVIDQDGSPGGFAVSLPTDRGVRSMRQFGGNLFGMLRSSSGLRTVRPERSDADLQGFVEAVRLSAPDIQEAANQAITGIHEDAVTPPM